MKYDFGNHFDFTNTTATGQGTLRVGIDNDTKKRQMALTGLRVIKYGPGSVYMMLKSSIKVA